jgi:glutamyl-Q tRNA(Asp) synthetase
VIAFTDLAWGQLECDLERLVGDFVIRRADGPFAYHLACVLDDAESGFTDIVRGSDLLACTPAQIHLQHLLGLPIPRYCHLPLALNEQGQKLSKQTHAPPVDRANPGEALCAALQILGYPVPPHLPRCSAAQIISWALEAQMCSVTPLP